MQLTIHPPCNLKHYVVVLVNVNNTCPSLSALLSLFFLFIQTAHTCGHFNNMNKNYFFVPHATEHHMKWHWYDDILQKILKSIYPPAPTLIPWQISFFVFELWPAVSHVFTSLLGSEISFIPFYTFYFLLEHTVHIWTFKACHTVKIHDINLMKLYACESQIIFSKPCISQTLQIIKWIHFVWILNIFTLY